MGGEHFSSATISKSALAAEAANLVQLTHFCSTSPYIKLRGNLTLFNPTDKFQSYYHVPPSSHMRISRRMLSFGPHQGARASWAFPMRSIHKHLDR